VNRIVVLVSLLIVVAGTTAANPVGTASIQEESTNIPPMCNPAIASPAPATPVASPSPVAIEFDQVYLDLMIVQQNRLLDLAKLGVIRADSPEVKGLADEIFDTTEPIRDRLRDTREAWFDDRPVLQNADLIAALDDIARLKPGVGGVPGAVEIVQGDGVVMELCSEAEDFDVHLLTDLIEQIDNGILFSEATKELAGRGETKVIAVLVVETDQPFKDDAIAFRDLLLQGSPIPDDH
jgi:uncharacterized protein (DUF305 family)